MGGGERELSFLFYNITHVRTNQDPVTMEMVATIVPNEPNTCQEVVLQRFHITSQCGHTRDQASCTGSLGRLPQAISKAWH